MIEIVGKRTTAARAIRPYGEDEGIDIIRLDGLQRANAGVGSGDFVEVRKADSKPATRVVFAPAQPNVRLQGSADALKRTFAGRPLVEGDTVATTGHQRINADMPDNSGRCSTHPRSRCRSFGWSSSRRCPRASSISTARPPSSCCRNIPPADERAPGRRHL